MASLFRTTDRSRNSVVEFRRVFPAFQSKFAVRCQFPRSVTFELTLPSKVGNCDPTYSRVSETTALLFATSTDFTTREKKALSVYPLLKRFVVPNAGMPPRSV